MTDDQDFAATPEPEPGTGNVSEADGPQTLDHEAALEALHAEWGEAFDDNMAMAQAAAATLSGTGIADVLEEAGLGDDPRIIRAAAEIGRLLRRDGDADSAPGRREALDSELEELTGSPDYWTDRVQRRVRQIYLQLYGSRSAPVHRDSGDAAGLE